MSIIITKKAQEELYKQFGKNESRMARIVLLSFGWAGPNFGVVLVKTKDEEKDYVEKIEDIEIIVEKDIKKRFGELKIDYLRWFNKGFLVSFGIRAKE